LGASRARGIPVADVEKAVAAATAGRRQFVFLGEPRINVLELNLALDGK
jgi:K+-transporting ATPase ATPase C chain